MTQTFSVTSFLCSGIMFESQCHDDTIFVNVMMTFISNSGKRARPPPPSAAIPSVWPRVPLTAALPRATPRYLALYSNQRVMYFFKKILEASTFCTNSQPIFSQFLAKSTSDNVLY